MRYVRDILLLLVLIGVAYGASVYKQYQRTEADALERTANETRRLESEIQYRAATKLVELNARGFPLTVDPKWFDKTPPENALLEDSRPWLEVAPSCDAGLMHPPIRMAITKDVACFWYNPYQGIVRARVPISVNDEAARAMYNRVNETSITSIFWIEPVQPTLKSAPEHALAADARSDDGLRLAKPSAPAHATVPDGHP